MTDRSKQEEVIGLLWFILAAGLSAADAWWPLVAISAAMGAFALIAAITYAIKDRKKP